MSLRSIFATACFAALGFVVAFTIVEMKLHHVEHAPQYAAEREARHAQEARDAQAQVPARDAATDRLLMEVKRANAEARAKAHPEDEPIYRYLSIPSTGAKAP
jgi:sRNA-binding protein